MEETIITPTDRPADTTPPEDTTAAAEQTATAAPSTTADEPGDSGWALPVRFNRQDYHLTHEEAVTYAQKGMKYTTLEPMLERLQTLAKQNGLSAAALVDALCGEGDGDPERQLAEEFCRLREVCPELDTFDKVPEPVVQHALDNEIPLLYAYLYYRHGEETRIRRANAVKAAATAASAGTQRGEAEPAADPTVEAMVRGIWGA